MSSDGFEVGHYLLPKPTGAKGKGRGKRNAARTNHIDASGVEDRRRLHSETTTQEDSSEKVETSLTVLPAQSHQRQQRKSAKTALENMKDFVPSDTSESDCERNEGQSPMKSEEISFHACAEIEAFLEQKRRASASECSSADSSLTEYHAYESSGTASSLDKILRAKSPEANRLEVADIGKDAEDAEERQEEQPAATLGALKELFTVRTQELVASQAWLSTKESYSETDLVSLVQDLNDCIEQLAARLVDKVKQVEVANGRAEKYLSPNKALEVALGIKMVVALKGPAFAEHKAKCAIQAAFVAVLADYIPVIDTTGFGLKLDEMYKKIQDVALPSVAYQWRSLSYSHFPSEAKEWHREKMRAIVEDNVARILGMAMLGTGPRAKKAVSLSGGGFDEIFERAARIKEIFLKEITSSDYQVFVIAPGCSFVAANMVNFDEEHKTGAGKVGGNEGNKGLRVMCTCSMGLRWKRNGLDIQGDRVDETKILLQPKVIVDATWRD